jgi:hypothetical protein
VHSRASDGRGTVEEIATAAARAGLQFIVLTDHGDATRRPEPPAYLSGVLMLDGVEISTRGGHYIAIGLPKAPYPLGGEAADVVEDVRRMGGFGIAAHPDSPKPELRWSDWNAPIDGFEIVNPDTSWRVHAFEGGLGAKWLLFRSLLTYPARSSETIARLLTDTSRLREQWMRIAEQRTLVALAGVDAHAKLALADREPGDNSYSVPFPDYESSFRSLSVHVSLARRLSGDAAADAAMLLDGLRAGRVYVAVDGWASPASFEFSATSGNAVLQPGSTLRSTQPLTLRVRSNAPDGFRTVVWKGSERLSERTERQFELPLAAGPGVYFVEIRSDRPDGPPWVTSNPIYVRSNTARVTASSDPLPSGGAVLFDGRSTRGWSPERDETSLSDVDVAQLVAGNRIRLRYGLSGGAAFGQYSAAAVETATGVDGFVGIVFGVRGEGPMRISVQVRAEVQGSVPERWERSVFVDAGEQTRFVRFADMLPVGRTQSARPPGRDVRAIMFVVDTTNTRPGASGQLWLGNIRLVRE